MDDLDASITEDAEDVQSTGPAWTSSRMDADIEHVAWKSPASSISRTDKRTNLDVEHVDSMVESRRRTWAGLSQRN